MQDTSTLTSIKTLPQIFNLELARHNDKSQTLKFSLEPQAPATQKETLTTAITKYNKSATNPLTATDGMRVFAYNNPSPPSGLDGDLTRMYCILQPTEDPTVFNFYNVIGYRNKVRSSLEKNEIDSWHEDSVIETGKQQLVQKDGKFTWRIIESSSSESKILSRPSITKKQAAKIAEWVMEKHPEWLEKGQTKDELAAQMQGFVSEFKKGKYVLTIGAQEVLMGGDGNNITLDYANARGHCVITRTQIIDYVTPPLHSHINGMEAADLQKLVTGAITKMSPDLAEKLKNSKLSLQITDGEIVDGAWKGKIRINNTTGTDYKGPTEIECAFKINNRRMELLVAYNAQQHREVLEVVGFSNLTYSFYSSQEASFEWEKAAGIATISAAKPDSRADIPPIVQTDSSQEQATQSKEPITPVIEANPEPLPSQEPPKQNMPSEPINTIIQKLESQGVTAYTTKEKGAAAEEQHGEQVKSQKTLAEMTKSLTHTIAKAFGRDSISKKQKEVASLDKELKSLKSDLEVIRTKLNAAKEDIEIAKKGVQLLAEQLEKLDGKADKTQECLKRVADTKQKLSEQMSRIDNLSVKINDLESKETKAQTKLNVTEIKLGDSKKELKELQEKQRAAAASKKGGVER